MKKISGSTTFMKKIFPVIWFGFLAVLAVSLFTRDSVVGEDRWFAVLAPCFMALVGFLVMKKAVWDLVDEVHDGGDYLLVRKGSEEERIPLGNIMNVSVSTNHSPQRITLRLAKSGRLGSEIAFIPLTRLSFNPFAKNPVGEDLIVRTYEARTKR